MSETISYFLYDGRYLSDPERSTLYECCDTLDEAIKEAPEYGDDTVIVEVVIINDEITSKKIIV